MTMCLVGRRACPGIRESIDRSGFQRILRLAVCAISFSIAAQALSSTAVTLTPSANPSNFGQAVTLSATVTGGATGKVTFYDATTILGVGTISGTTASMTTILLASGSRSLRAHYWGDLDHSSGDSPSITQTVVAGVSPGLHSAVNWGAGVNADAVAVGDFNGDLKADLVVSDFGQNGVSVLLGNGNGTFQNAVNYATDMYSNIVLVGDWNGDGKADLAVASAASSSISILLGNGDGTFQNAVKTNSFPIQAMAVGDFNGDGKADLVIASGFQASTMGILLGNGDGTFQARVNFTLPSMAYSVSVGDLNSDGKADLVFGGGSGSVYVVLGNGNGTFGTPVSYSAGPSPQSVALGDFNGDGKLDIAAVDNNSFYPLAILSGNGNGTFQPAASSSLQHGSLLAADFNGDGKLDLLVSNGNSGVIALAGNGDGTFATATSYLVPSGSFASLGIADFNGDGKADIAVGNYFNNNVSILLGGAMADLAISVNHGNGLTQGQIGAAYNITVGNVGDLPTIDAVRVSDSFPPGLTATAIAGDGWTCTLATLSCTRFDVLIPGASYPAIKITLNVPNNVSGSVTNSVAVTGGGDGNPANNTAVDTTTARASSTIALTSAPNPSVLGQALVLTTTVNAGSTGKVTFYDATAGSATVLGLATLSGTQATLTTKLLPSGSRSIFARYDGDNNYGPSVSAIVTQVVNAASTNGYQPPLTFHTGLAASSIAVADLNGDGKLDLITGNATDHSISVLLGNGDGSFKTAVTYPVGGTNNGAVAVGDLNGDGKVDVLVPNSNFPSAAGYGLFVLFGNGDGTLQTAVGRTPNGNYATVKIADLNQDGILDVVAGDGSAHAAYALLGNGDGTFQSALTVPLTGDNFIGQEYWAVTDLNHDGYPDVIVPNAGAAQPVGVFLGNGDGTFRAAAYYPGLPYQYTDGLVAGDFNGDGKPDIAMLYWIGVGVLLGNGDGSLQPLRSSDLMGQVPWSPVLTGDFNGDGKLDFVYRGYTSPDFSIVLGKGDGTFQPVVSTFLTAGTGGAMVSADFNGDGKPDIAVANGGTGNAVGTGNDVINIFLGTAFSGLQIGVTHTGNLTAGKTKTYQISVTNPAFAPTSGLVSVTGALPSGLSSTGIAGDGWSCTLATLTCTRSDALSTGSSFPPVALTALAAGSLSPSTLTPSASVIFASVTNSIGDPTLIVAPTVTVLTISPAQSVLSQVVTITATVSGGSGSVLFLDGTTILGTAQIVGSQATLATGLLPAGTHSIIATYSGDSTHGLSMSSQVLYIVSGVAANGFLPGTSLATGAGPNTVLTGDLNSDGKTDLVVVHQTANTVGIFLGVGDGTFQPRSDYTVGTQPLGAAIADFNRDGKPDIAVANQGGSISILLNQGNGTFVPGTTIVSNYSDSVVAADFDGDGNPDLAIFGGNSMVVILYGLGDGTFLTVPGPTGACCNIGLVAADFNTDGKADLLTGATVHLNNGDRSFQAGLYTNVGASGWAAADLNGDGKADLVATGNANTVGVLLGKGDGTFQNIVSYPVGSGPTGVTIADMNGDGKLDLIVANTSGNTISVLLGNGDGTFQNSLSYAVGSSPQSVVAGDFNNDWHTDLAVANYGSNNVSILLGVSSGGLRIVSSHTGDFYIGQVGALYTLTVSNLGQNPISGPFTVIDQLPPGLTATAIVGTGWNCVLSTLTCTQSSSLGAGASFQPIIIGVNVAPNPPAQATNTATAGAPGAVTASASDLTNITPLPAPLLISPSGGQSGVPLTVALSWNPAPGATSYDVYFGTQSTPPMVTNTTATNYTPPTLAAGTVYYWKVASRNFVGTASSVTLFFTTQAPSGSFTPLRVHAGGQSYFDPGAGNIWSADTGYLGGSTYSTVSSIGNTSTVGLYETERWATGTLEYRFTVPNGTYAVNLKFAEIYFTIAGQRVFNIVLNGQTALTSFDPFTAAGGANLAIDKSYPVTVTNGQIDIQLVAVVSNPKISAIEITAGSVQPPPPPPSGTFTPIRVNAGGPAYTDPGTGNVWSADTGSLGGSTYATGNPISNTTTPTLYQTERWSSGTLEYSYTVPNGTYTVNLKFAEIYFTSSGQRVFNIVLNGQTALASFDPFAAAGGSNRAVDKSYSVTVTNGRIDIQMVAVVSNPKVSAIEITSGGSTPPPSGNFTPIRVNAGGPAYTDSATSNVWSADTGFLGGSTYSTGTSIGNTSTATLYQTERWSSGTLEYSFTVPNGTYTVNLKFAEIYFTSSGQRVFNIVVNGQTKLASFDPFAAAGGANRAIDKSYSVTVTNGQLDIQLVAIVSNPKISAIEILQ